MPPTRAYPRAKIPERRNSCNRQARRIGTVGEDMAKMSVAESAFYFATQHAHAEVLLFADVFLRDGFPEARPARSRFKLGLRVEKGGGAIRAAKNPGAMFVQ